MNLSLRPGVRKTTLNPCTQGCGRHTRAACGICEPCQRGAPVAVPALSRFTDDQLTDLMRGAVAELKRREERLREALAMANAFGGGES